MEFSLDSTFTFGKYKGTPTTIRKAIEDDLDYITWCVETIDWFDLDYDAQKYYEFNHEVGDEDNNDHEEYDFHTPAPW